MVVDRQKILRKIKQAKHSVDSMGTPPESLPALEQTLLSHRVDLNYVRVRHFANYPSQFKS